MKILEVVDKESKSMIIICEGHFKKYYQHIDGSVKSGLTIIIKDTRKKGCAFCSRERSGCSPWAGDLFVIWKKYKEWESKSESR
jgi:hypothetical protein